MADDQPDRERVQESARERQRDRTESVERMAGRADELLGEHKYPTTSEELAAEYANEEIELANETESLGSVFDRLVDERFESAEEAREAVYNEITGEASGTGEYNDERDLTAVEEGTDEDLTESGSRDR